MIEKDNLKQLSEKLKPCCKCGGEVSLVLSRPTLSEARASSRNCNYVVNIACHRCKKHMRGMANLASSDDYAPILNAIRVWNELNDASSKIFPIDEKLMGFDDDQKSFVCILLYLAGYKFTPEDLSKYIQHSTINIRETFESMTQEQKSMAFVMIGQALGYLPEGDAIK